jgi:hypothetical protein
MAKREDKAAVIGVSCPGGIARQFRVQEANEEMPTNWELAGSFRDEAGASQCAEKIRRAGKRARIVEWRALPTAA